MQKELSAEQKTTLPYGLWPSPVAPLMASQGIRLEDVQWDSDGRSLVWLEGRSDRGVLVTCEPGGPNKELTDEHNVRAWVGYGGGDFCAGGGSVFYVEIGGRIFRRELESGMPSAVTPPYGTAASMKLSPDGKWLLYVFSDRQTDLLALVDAAGRNWPVQLAKGADFYMQPCWHPDGTRIAWVEWDHPHMPWDHTRIQMARLAGTPPAAADSWTIVDEPDTAAVQPLFSPDGQWLSYIVDNGDWDDLVLLHLESGQRRVLVHGDGFHLAYPAWGQGGSSYGWSHTSQSLFFIRNFGGQASLWQVDLGSGVSHPLDTGAYTMFTQLSISPAADHLAMIASAPHIPSRLVWWDGKELRTLRHSMPEYLDAAFLPGPQPVTWDASDGTQVHATYYPPANPGFTGTGLPPALVYVHGGPTGCTPVSYNAFRTFFTSRGYGWLDLNYRGSTGYGHSYRKLMRQRWGDVDTEDARDAALALAEQGLADGSRLVIIGGSAGGYLVLNALVRYPGCYRVGVDLFGVSNLFNLAMDTHKFEAHYLDSMVGPLPEAADRYRAWSPIFQADHIRDPLAIFQGAIDVVVPPNQSEDLLAVLQRNGVPHFYCKYEGEGHGFRKTENNVDMLVKTERFLRQYVLFAG
jgi:dipeptidyl aminopeptidase/acylaminoacyl peptidase